MPIKQFTIGFSRTVNLGNYESARVEASVTLEINDKEKVIQQLELSQIELRNILEKTWNEQKNTINGKQKP